MLQHKFEIEHADGSKETRTSTLCEYGAQYGSGGYSAMARLVGVPAAVGTQLVLNGTIKERGVLAPLSGEINGPLIKELKEKYGIECIEKTIA
jgi:saccharopine dehydrogenase (NADP+, L-glutamate forming)